MNQFRIKERIKYLENQEVLRIEDEDGREYMWDGLELYRCIPLKGKFGRKEKAESIFDKIMEN